MRLVFWCCCCIQSHLIKVHSYFIKLTCCWLVDTVISESNIACTVKKFLYIHIIWLCAFTDPAIVLSMLSFIFVIVCGLYERKQNYAGVYLLFAFTYRYCHSNSGRIWDSINRIKPVSFLCLSQSRTWIFNAIYN